MKEFKIVLKIPEGQDLKNWFKEKIKALAAYLWRGTKNAWQDIKTKKYRTYLIISLFIVLVWKTTWNAAILWPLFVAFVLYAWDSRVLAGGALVALASCPFLLAGRKDSVAETMAIYAYYFLVMTVAAQIIELARDKAKASTEENSIAGLDTVLESEFSSPYLNQIETKPSTSQETAFAGTLPVVPNAWTGNIIANIKANLRFLFEQNRNIFGLLRNSLRRLREKQDQNIMDEKEIIAKSRLVDHDPEWRDTMEHIELEFSSPGLDDLESMQGKETVSAYSEYLKDAADIDLREKGARERAIAMAKNAARQISKSEFIRIIIDWTRDAIRITFNSFFGNGYNDKTVSDQEKEATGSMLYIEALRIENNQKFGHSPDLLSQKSPNQITSQKEGFNHSLSFVTLFANMILLIVGSAYVYETIISGDPSKLVIKLLLVTILIIFSNLFIKYNYADRN